jgi:hypothetical protein
MAAIADRTFQLLQPQESAALREKAGLKWREFGRRHASFSVDYLLFRLAQHRIPGATSLRKIASKAGRIMLPLYLGEIYRVWTLSNVVRPAD